MTDSALLKLFGFVNIGWCHAAVANVGTAGKGVYNYRCHATGAGVYVAAVDGIIHVSPSAGLAKGIHAHIVPAGR